MATPSQVVTGPNVTNVPKVSPDGQICWHNATVITKGGSNFIASDGSSWNLAAGGITLTRNGSAVTYPPAAIMQILAWSGGNFWATSDNVNWYMAPPTGGAFTLQAGLLPPFASLLNVNAQMASQPPVGGCWNRASKGPASGLINSSPSFSGPDIGALLPSAALGGIAQGGA